MVPYRKYLTIAAISLFVMAGIAATSPSADHKFKKLKILPKDISEEDLDKVMDGFNAALGVKCGFCHAKSQDSTQRYPDFASDEKPEKGIARSMMKMTNKINKKYFSYNKNEQGQAIATVECITCHRGKAHPGR